VVAAGSRDLVQRRSDGVDRDIRSVGYLDKGCDVASIRGDEPHRSAVAALFADGDDLRIDR
jgi:hypothetical protein